MRVFQFSSKSCFSSSQDRKHKYVNDSCLTFRSDRGSEFDRLQERLTNKRWQLSLPSVFPRTQNHDNMQICVRFNGILENTRSFWWVWWKKLAVTVAIKLRKSWNLPEFRLRRLPDCWCLHSTWDAASARSRRKTLTILLLHISFLTLSFWHRFSFSLLSLDTLSLMVNTHFCILCDASMFFLSFFFLLSYLSSLSRNLGCAYLFIWLKKRRNLIWELRSSFTFVSEILSEPTTRWNYRK